MILLKNINYEISQDMCEVDISHLDELLLKLPTELYIELYVKMKNHIQYQCLDKFEGSEDK